jgi:methanogenic corrinoid protein MtbC1
MRSRIAEGLSAAEAARLVLTSPPRGAQDAEPSLDEPIRALREALVAFDDARAHAALDQLIASLSLESFLRSVVLPLLREIGEGWERGEITVAQEHFSSNLIRGRLLALGRGWGRGAGRHALLAAPAGERHDLGLVVLALVLRDHGWRVTFLGADTPIGTIADTSRRVAPEVVVLAVLAPLDLDADEVRELVRGRRVVLAGAGATPGQARKLGVEHFEGGPIEAASFLAAGVAAAR